MNLLEKYMALPYTTILKRDEEGNFVAKVKELKGCVADGETEIAALRALESMKKLWLESCVEDGDEIPQPDAQGELPSGKWLQRVPRSLHKQLIERAEYEGVSLNSYVSSRLALAIGAAPKAPPKDTSVDLQAVGGVSSWYICDPAPKDFGLIAWGGKSLWESKPTRGLVGTGGAGKSYAAFACSLAEQLPNHSTSVVERSHRENEEEYQEKAYA